MESRSGAAAPVEDQFGLAAFDREDPDALTLVIAVLDDDLHDAGASLDIILILILIVFRLPPVGRGIR
ncbi:MAG: hypothetical protein IMF05_06690 [Proteobacteria bacterium]|nr:hypothetical protein [Pseudomonadota bacterium]